MKTFFTALLSLLFFTGLKAQNTISFQPGPLIGEDAYLLFTDNNCVPSSTYPLPGGDANYANNPEIVLNRWTITSQGCPEGTMRSVIRFTELNTIPSGANIISAQLILKTPPPGYTWTGNSFYPGSPFPLPNPGWVKLIKPGNIYAWKEETVTWNNFITLDPVNTNIPPTQIPATNSEYNWTSTIDVTAMVVQIMSDLNTYGNVGNNGFLLEVQDEQIYRGQVYASSDNLHTQSRPELIITYGDCNAYFSYTVHSDNPNHYSFVATNANAATYKWLINGLDVGYSSVLNYQFSPGGNYEVCLDLSTNEIPCKECLDICTSGSVSSIAPIASNQGKLIINPNPTKTGWNLKLNANSKTQVFIQVTDATGKAVRTSQQQIESGFNSIYINGEGLANGVYILSIKGKNGLKYDEKIIKE